MDQQERHYDSNKLNRLFAIAALILLFALAAMVQDDYQREWKNFQRDFQALEVEKTRVKLDRELNKLKGSPEFKEVTEKLKTARQEYTAKCANVAGLKKELTNARADNDILNQQFRVTKAQLDAAKFQFEDAQEKKLASAPKAKKNYSTLTAKVADLKTAIEKSDAGITATSAAINSCGAWLTDLEKQDRALAAPVTILERKLKRIDTDQMDFTNRIAQIVRDLPIVDLANPNYKIQQIVLSDLTDDVNFMRVPKVDRCITCHQGITNPDFKDAPQPFRTHPNLELYLGKNSAHPMEEFGCTVCHDGRGRGTDFNSTAHTPRSHEQAEEWKKKYNWKEMHHWQTPMYPAQYSEAGCFKCHSSETVIKGAEKLNLGLNLIEKAGCYACHNIERYKDWPKPGPDLTHLAIKTSPEWAYRWIEDPQSLRHNTWMPAFFNQSNNNDPQSRERAQQEIHSIVHYLFAHSAEFPFASMPEQWGNVQTGEEIVSSIGCMACHNVAPDANTEPRTLQSLRREQGPNLIGLGSKTNKEWLYSWLKDPNRYHPQTKMPNLRLTDKEAADAAAYLAQDKSGAAKTPLPIVNDRIISEIAEDFLKKNFTKDQTAEKLGKMSAEDKLNFAGEKLIGQYGCYSCHNIAGFENNKPIGTDLTEEGSKDIHNLDFAFIHLEHTKQAWFKQKLLDPRIFDKDKIKAADEKLRMPNYNFNEREAEAIVTALLGFVKDKPAASKMRPRSAKNLYLEEGQKLIRQLNCQGCHVIEGDGGAIQPSIVDWMVKFDNRSEDEAKSLVKSLSPPDLIGEGKKVHPQWLFEFLHQPTEIRPWLKTRMPTYSLNAAHLNTLVKYFNTLDKEEFPFTEFMDTTLSPEEFQAAEKLFSAEYFNCAQCHIVGDKMPSGSLENWAPNFALAKSRLKPGWLEEWIKNPQALSPGTKMPNFFDPQNLETSGPEDILGGDENAQIRALRNYILTLSNPAPSAKAEIPAPEASATPAASSDAPVPTPPAANAPAAPAADEDDFWGEDEPAAPAAGTTATKP